MNKYKFLKQKAFEKLETFEARLHEMLAAGWRVNSFTSDHGSMVVLLDRER